MDSALFDRVIRMRVGLAAGLVIPLGFFVFLVLWFREAWLLAGIGTMVYLYILAQFFVWQNPRRKALRRAGQGTAEGPSAPGPAGQETVAPAPGDGNP